MVVVVTRVIVRNKFQRVLQIVLEELFEKDCFHNECIYYVKSKFDNKYLCYDGNKLYYIDGVMKNKADDTPTL